MREKDSLVREHLKLYVYSLILSSFYFLNNLHNGQWSFSLGTVVGYLFIGSLYFLVVFLSMEVAALIANESEHVLALTLE
jgi:hypothetical protein